MSLQELVQAAHNIWTFSEHYSLLPCPVRVAVLAVPNQLHTTGLSPIWSVLPCDWFSCYFNISFKVYSSFVSTISSIYAGCCLCWLLFSLLILSAEGWWSYLYYDHFLSNHLPVLCIWYTHALPTLTFLFSQVLSRNILRWERSDS